MTEPKARQVAGGPEPGTFDQELDLRGVVSFGIGLALTMIVVLGMVWLMVAHWKSRQIARDPPPSPIAEARAPRLPPAPRQQSSPVLDLEPLLARGDPLLTSYRCVEP